jgi:ankyrin repeat protein
MTDLLAKIVKGSFRMLGPLARVCGVPLLDLSLAFDRLDLVQWLVQRGVSLTEADERGRTALHRAQSPEQVDALRQLGLRVAQVDRAGRQPAHVAARAGRVSVLEALHASGADLGAVSARGRTPLHEAAGRGREACVAFLLRHGVDADALDRRGHSALRLAALGGHVDVARMLIEHGASQAFRAQSGLAWWHGVPQRVAGAMAALAGQAPSQWSPSSSDTERLAAKLSSVQGTGRAWRPANWSMDTGV